MSEPSVNTTSNNSWINNIRSMSKEDMLELPVDIAVFYMCCLQTDALDEQIKTAIKELETIQKNISVARKAIEILKNTESGTSSGGSYTKNMDYSEVKQQHPEEMAYLESLGIVAGDQLILSTGSANLTGDQVKTKLKECIEKVENDIKDKNVSVEMYNLNIQSLMSKRGQQFEMTTTIMKKSADTKSGIIHNT